LPAKNANNLKINFNFMLAKPSNPLKQGISHNHKQGRNFMATRKLSDTRASETQGCQASESLVIPYKGEVIQLSEENKRSKGKN
jgi:hypothetical protein